MPIINAHTMNINADALQKVQNKDAIVQATVKGNARDGRTVTLKTYDPKQATTLQKFKHALSINALIKEHRAAKLLSSNEKAGWKITVAQATPKLNQIVQQQGNKETLQQSDKAHPQPTEQAPIYENYTPTQLGHDNPGFVSDDESPYINMPLPPYSNRPQTPPPVYENAGYGSIEDDNEIYSEVPSEIKTASPTQQDISDLLPNIPLSVANALKEQNYAAADQALQQHIKDTVSLVDITNVEGRAFKGMTPVQETALQFAKNGKYLPGNKLTSPIGGSTFMAIGAPTLGHTANIWHLALREHSSVIVDLTNAKDRKSDPKLVEYYPTQKNPKLEAGNIQIQWLSSEKKADGYTVEHYQVTDTTTNQSTAIDRHHFTRWPDHGVPDGEADQVFTKLKEEVALATKEQSCDAIVHCRAGVGRTGTLITEQWLNEAFDKAEESGVPITTKEQLDTLIFQLIELGRTQRNFAFVQKTVQLELIIQHGETRILGETLVAWVQETQKTASAFRDNESLERYFNENIITAIEDLKLTHATDPENLKEVLKPFLEAAKKVASFPE